MTAASEVPPPPAPTPEEIARAAAAAAKAEAAREALYAERRKARAEEQAREDAATDIGGVEIASMGKAVTLPATNEVLRRLKKLPPTVRKLTLKGGDLAGQHVAPVLAALSLDSLDLTGNALSAEDVAALPDAKLGVQKLPESASMDVAPWDFRRARPERVYPTWARWLTRLTEAARVLFARHDATDATLAGLMPPSATDEEAACAAVYAWGEVASVWARDRKDVKDATLKRAVVAIKKAADGVQHHEESDTPYEGILRTAEALPFVVGASLASSSRRPAWLVSQAEIARLREELRDVL